MKQRGVVFVASLGLLVLLAIVGSTVLLRGLHEEGSSRRARSQHRALFFAEAAVDVAIENLRSGQFGDLSTTPMAGGAYSAVIQDPSENPSLLPLQYLVTGAGQLVPEQRAVEALTQLTPQSVFQFALFGNQRVTVSGNAITDSYDSSLAPYDPNNPGQNGDVGTNATAAGQTTGISISGTIAINGQVAVGEDVADPSSVVTVSGGSYLITGEPDFISQTNSLQMPSVSLPEGLACNVAYTPSGQVTEELPADAPAGACNANNECCFSTMSVRGGATVTTSGNPVTVYVAGAFSATGSTTIGVATDPTQFVMILASPQQATLQGDWTGNTTFYGGIYSPTGTINVSGNAEIFGSVVANIVNVTGNAQVHYDEAMTTTGPIGSYEVQVMSWREL